MTGLSSRVIEKDQRMTEFTKVENSGQEWLLYHMSNGKLNKGICM